MTARRWTSRRWKTSARRCRKNCKRPPTRRASSARNSRSSNASTSNTNQTARGLRAPFCFCECPDSEVRKPSRHTLVRTSGSGHLVHLMVARAIGAVAVGVEALLELGMAQRLAGRVGQQILLRHIGDVLAFRVLGEQVVEGLILRRPDFFRNGKVPLLGIVERRIDVENHAAERKHAVTSDLSDAVFCLAAFGVHGAPLPPPI